MRTNRMRRIVWLAGGMLGLGSVASALQPGPISPAVQADDEITQPQDPEGATARIGDAAPLFALRSLDDEEVRLIDITDEGCAVVLLWIDPRCPRTLAMFEGDAPSVVQDLAEKFGGESLKFVAIATGVGDAPADGPSVVTGPGVEMFRRAKERWQIEFPILLDDRGEVAAQYGAMITPLAFVVDGKGTLIYRGAVDNRVSPGAAPTERTLEQLLTLLAEGQTIEPYQTEAKGCAIRTPETPRTPTTGS